jgi:hypothetical protein
MGRQHASSSVKESGTATKAFAEKQRYSVSAPGSGKPMPEARWEALIWPVRKVWLRMAVTRWPSFQLFQEVELEKITVPAMSLQGTRGELVVVVEWDLWWV